MNTLHPIFVNIFQSFGMIPTELDEEERCPGCSVTREQHRHMEAPCLFSECPFKETK